MERAPVVSWLSGILAVADEEAHVCVTVVAVQSTQPARRRCPSTTTPPTCPAQPDLTHLCDGKPSLPILALEEDDCDLPSALEAPSLAHLSPIGTGMHERLDELVDLSRDLTLDVRLDGLS